MLDHHVEGVQWLSLTYKKKMGSCFKRFEIIVDDKRYNVLKCVNDYREKILRLRNLKSHMLKTTFGDLYLYYFLIIPTRI